MPSLSQTGARFEIPLTVIEGGSGRFHGVLVETSQNTTTATVFTEPRQILRVRACALVRPGLVVRSPLGQVYILADNGPSEAAEGTLWNSYKLFEATRKVSWQRRGRVTDPVTSLEIEGAHQDLGMVWAAIEPMTREAIERRLHVNIEQAQFITGAAVQRDDVLDGRPVTRSDVQLGIRIGVLS